MAKYLANRIKAGKLDYSEVIAKYPQYKEGIDQALIAAGRGDLIVE